MADSTTREVPVTIRDPHCGWWLGCALLGAALGGCGSARSNTLSTRGISDPAPGGEQACEGQFEFVALGSLPEIAQSFWLALDRSSQRAAWSFRSGQTASSFHWSKEQGISELRLDALEAQWNPAAETSLLQVLSSSADGSVGAGVSYATRGAAGFRWSDSGEVSQLDFVPYAVNRDGTVIAGVQGYKQLARWTRARGVELLGIPQAEGRNLLLSAAGDVIAGNELNGRCHRWTEAAGDQDLGLLPGMATCMPVLMNDSGDVVIGATQANPDSPTQLFRWTLAQGLQDLRVGDGVTENAWPKAMSADGSVVAVQLNATDGSFSRFARWAEGAGAQEIEPGTNLLPTYVSPLGDVVIGTLFGSVVREIGSSVYWESFRWTEADGLQRLGVAGLGLALGGQLMVGTGPTGAEIRKLGALGSGAPLIDLLPPDIVPEGWSDPLLQGVSEDGGMLFGSALSPDGDRQLWLQRLSCPNP